MFEKLKELYKTNKITEEGLRKAIEKKWITAEEMELIIREN